MRRGLSRRRIQIPLRRRGPPLKGRRERSRIAEPSTGERAENAPHDATGLSACLSGADPILRGSPNPPSIKPIPFKQLEVERIVFVIIDVWNLPRR